MVILGAGTIFGHCHILSPDQLIVFAFSSTYLVLILIMFPVLAQYDLLVFRGALAGWLLYLATARAPGPAAGLTPAAHSAAELAGFGRFSPDSSAFPFASVTGGPTLRSRESSTGAIRLSHRRNYSARVQLRCARLPRTLTVLLVILAV